MGADYRYSHHSMLASQSRDNLAAGATQYMGPGDGFKATRPEVEVRVPFDCIVDHLHARSENTPGAGETYDYTVFMNNTVTVLTCQVVNPNRDAEDLVNAVTILRGNRFSIRVVASALAAVGEHSATVRVRQI